MKPAPISLKYLTEKAVFTFIPIHLYSPIIIYWMKMPWLMQAMFFLIYTKAIFIGMKKARIIITILHDKKVLLNRHLATYFPNKACAGLGI